MFNRAINLHCFSTIVRQITNTKTITRQIQIKTELASVRKETNENESSQPIQNNRKNSPNQNTNIFKKEKVDNIKYKNDYIPNEKVQNSRNDYHNNEIRRNNFSKQDDQNLIRNSTKSTQRYEDGNPNRDLGNFNSLKTKSNHNAPKVSYLNPYPSKSGLNNKEKEAYQNIMNSFTACLNLNQSLIPSCQNLLELDSRVSESFKSDLLKIPIIKQLQINLPNLQLNEFVTALRFIIKFNPEKIDSLNATELTSKCNDLNPAQLLSLYVTLRSIPKHSNIVVNLTRHTLDTAREKLSMIESLDDLLLASKAFANEKIILKKIDDKILKKCNNFSVNELIKLLNFKSIHRQRNPALLEACAFNLIANGKKNKKLDLKSIQSALLSCGVLNFFDELFLKFLCENLNEEIKANASNEKWVDSNHANLLSIINSIGMISIKEPTLINCICSLLNKNFSTNNVKLAISFVVSCASLNYHPTKEPFLELANKISETKFDFTNDKEKISLLTYVWSLCVLNITSHDLLSTVLNQSFWEPLLKSEDNPHLKGNLLKILNVNIYSMLLVDDYQGPNLPENFDISKYKQVLIPQQTSFTELFSSTLTSFRSLDKYIKLNMLTPFGILVDALMVIDKMGTPLLLENYFTEKNQMQTSDNELKVAFKLISFWDQNRINKDQNGINAFQIRLLNELGYETVTITQSELQSISLANRVNLIQQKLKNVAKNATTRD